MIFYIYKALLSSFHLSFTMGNVLIDLDQRFGKFQFKFLEVYTKGLFEMAASLLYQANCNLPFEARVTDMPMFKKEGRTLRSELVNEQKARDYCDNWGPIVWSSIADYTSKMLENLQD